jgi:hypothetical protein
VTIDTEEVVRKARLYMDDAVGTGNSYRVRDDDLVSLVAEAQIEACRRGRLLLDSTTIGIARVDAPVTGTSGDGLLVMLDPRVIQIRRVKLACQEIKLPAVMLRDLDRQMPDWESYTSDALAWCPDYQTGYVRLIGGATAGNAQMNMTVARLPLTDPQSIDDPLEIPEHYRFSLAYWPVYCALSVPDSELHNEEAAKLALAKFENEFGPARPAYDETWQERFYASDDFNGRY